MSAICGVIGPGASRQLLEPVLAILEPHGDVSTVITMPAGRSTACVGARHRAQHDHSVSEGHASAAPAPIAVIGDIRIDHRSDLIANLLLPSDSSDVDLVFAAYLKWGDHCISHLYGDFAFAVIDSSRGGVLLARDHAGHRPLAIHEGADFVAFATNALALTGLESVGNRLDNHHATEILALAYGSDRTMVDGVRLVPPGTAQWISDKGIKRWTWWTPAQIEIVDLGSLEAHAAALRDVLDDVVRVQLRTNGRPGVMLSGGLDSTAVAATAAPFVVPEQLRTYTSVPPAGWSGASPSSWDADETHLVKALARRYPNLAPRFVEVGKRNLFEHHEELWELGSGPVRNTMNAMWIYAIHEEASAEGVSALLTGASGNGAFSADGPRWLVDLAKHGRLVQATREVRAWARARESSTISAFRSEFAVHLTPSSLRSLRARRRGQSSRVEDWVGSTALRTDKAEALDMRALIPGLADFDGSRWTRQQVNRFGVGAAQAEHSSAMRAWWGVEMRDPTSDRRLLEVALAQPERWRRRQGVDRAIIRAAMADRLPSEIVDRTNRGSQLPDWFDRLIDVREDVAEQVEQTRDHPASREIIDVGRLESLVKSWPEREASESRTTARDYHLALPRAVMLSRYLRWFESRARRVESHGPVVVVPPR